MELFSLDAKIKLDISELESKINEAKRILADLDDEASVSVSADTSGFDSSMADVNSAIDSLGKNTATATAELDTSSADSSLEDITGDLTTYDDKSVSADAGLDTSGADTSLGDIEGDLGTYDASTYSATAEITDDATADIEDIESSAEEYDGETYTASADLTDNASAPLGDITEAAGDAEEAVGDDGLNGVLANFGTAFSVAAVVAGLGLIIDTAWEAVMATAQIGDTIDKQSQMMGMSASAYQQWSYVLSRNGADISVMRAITRNITTQFKPGNNDFTDNLNKLGIDYNTFKGWSSEEQTYNLIRTLTAARNSGKYNDTQFAQIAESLLGSRAYQQLMPLFNSGLGSFDELWGFAGENLMSDEAVKNSATLTDSLTALNDAWSGLVNTIMGENILPIITGIVDGITSIVTDLRTAKDEKISLWGLLTGVDDGGLDRVAAVGDEYNHDLAMAEVNAQRANTLVTVLTDLEAQMGPLAKDTDTWKNAMAELESIYPGITDVINENNGSFLTGAENIREYISAQKELAVVAAKQKALEKYSEAVTNETAKLYDYQAQAIAARTELEGIIGKNTPEYTLGVDQAIADIAFYRQNIKAFTGDFDPYKRQWDYSRRDMYLASIGWSQERLNAVEQLNSVGFDAWDRYNDATESAKNQEAAVQAAIDGYNNMATLIETTVTSAMTGAGDGATALGTATANAAEKINNLSFRPKAVGYANGLWKVPYDGFDAQLHQGEAVLNRVEAERWRNGGTGGKSIDATATLNIGTFVSNGQSDERTLVAALVAEQKRQLRAVGERA